MAKQSKKQDKGSVKASGTRVVQNLMTGKDVVIAADTPWCCNPASETYWSM